MMTTRMEGETPLDKTTEDKYLRFKYFKESLTSEVLNVSFTKKDGTIRYMMCTLMDEFIPDSDTPKGTGASLIDKPIETRYDTVPVYDLEKMAWRSITIDKIISVGTVSR